MNAALDLADPAKCELAAEAIRAFGGLRFRVTGSSMLPAIRPGDVLWIRRCDASEVAPGDVVLFARSRRLFAHRVVARSGACLVTQGDGMPQPDPPVNASELVGRVCRILHRGRAFRPRAKLSFGGRVTAALVRCSALAGRLLTHLQGLPARVGL